MKKEFSTNDHIHPDNGKNPHNQDSPKTELGMTINWNNSLVKHWGYSHRRRNPESLADIHPSSPYQTPIYPTNNDTRYSRRCHRLGTCIPAFTTT